ncbi:Nitrogen permease regulator 3 [Podila epigama]|nr:Nitrogen permease regulator 3 [Podila epigama]
MHGLVGIIIVTNSSRGHHFVYKYPREPQPGTDNATYSQTVGSRSQAPETKASSPMHQHGDEFQTSANVLGYDPQFLANVLSPKLALCDKRFQLTVDDLTFIGHPVSLTGPEFRQRREFLKYKASRPPKQQVKRGWIIEGSAPFLDDSDSDSDYFEDDSNDETDSVKGSTTSKSIKDGVSGKEGLFRRGSKEEPEMASLGTRSYTDPAGWRAQRFRSHTYTSNPGSPASGDSPLSGQTPQQQTTPSLAHQSSFAASLLHHPMSMPQTPTGGVQGNFGHLGIPPIQINHSGSTTTPNIFSQTLTTTTTTTTTTTSTGTPTGTSASGAPSTTTSTTTTTTMTTGSSSLFQNMSFFHIVFVIKPAELQLNTVADQVYKNIACKLTAALRYEELNSHYVSQEASKILGIREEAAQAEQFHQQVLASSSLARAIQLIYEGISLDKVCHVMLNDSIDITLQIPHLAPLPRASSYVNRQIQHTGQGDSPTTMTANGAHGSQSQTGNHVAGSVADGMTGGGGGGGANGYGGANQQVLTPMVTQHWGIGGMGYMMDDFEVGYAYEYENFPVLFPYHTLLLLEDPEEILKDIPLDANPTLDELQYILDCSMAQIYRLASHLIYWRKAKLIDQIRISNVYVVAPQAEINESVVAEFSQHFPSLSLPSILHELSTPKAFKAHIPGAGKDKEVQTLYLEMLTHLLRKDLIVQLHTYILILVPEYIKIGCSLETYEHMMSEENSGALTPTLESPVTNSPLLPPSNMISSSSAIGHVGSAKSADFVQPRQHQQQQQQQALQNQSAMPSQTYRYHNRSSTGPGQPSGMSSSVKSNMSGPFKLSGKRQDASSILPNPGQASETEREWIMRMCENQPQSVHRLFMRLIQYFDGQHHVEEILFREQIVAKDLKTVLTAFREFLILTWA